MDKFLEMFSFLRLNQEEIETMEDHLLVIKWISIKKKKKIPNRSPGPDNFTGKFYQTLTVSPLYMNLQVANFQRCECMFTCQIMQVGSCIQYTLSHVCIIYKWLCFCVQGRARSARGWLHWTMQHKELTNEDLMELEAQRKDEER